MKSSQMVPWCIRSCINHLPADRFVGRDVNCYVGDQELKCFSPPKTLLPFKQKKVVD